MTASKSPTPLLFLASFGLLALGTIFWWARDTGSSFSLAPSLANLPAAMRQAAPVAPAQADWISPLRRSCDVLDQKQRQHLQMLLADLRQSPGRVRVDPSNYGERFRQDAFGNPVDPTPQLVVLHETVYGIASAINTFVTKHPRDHDQVSYHALIGGDGAVIKLLDPSKRAFGAGNSAFNGQWVVTNPNVGGSINNFGLHVSLETPLDGEDNDSEHSGYSAAQYDALAVVLAEWMARFQIRPEKITTHKYVDLGGERSDPRSFNWQALQERLQNLGLLC
ncbi:N-acetylmuramoyl-L-alanine amidase [Cyanobium sp. HWJ4-Hawea]|uniref:N-acetylmuramoyl-L-alanine amidase n=1 Tax=Cyanobium sp. HWJ4-Hawea TaxID=2823713 RepID=UPI0020CC3B8C|nr:peptidoglycan recognition family protein [Cyanobium sp. HWJ4-Hawea]MCP9809601.1 N-acetylmuramoyl-L-alanine amidase [Cyanobium sp. HWJ4-Hawea]